MFGRGLIIIFILVLIYFCVFLHPSAHSPQQQQLEILFSYLFVCTKNIL